jgi:hypothetical protein
MTYVGCGADLPAAVGEDLPQPASRDGAYGTTLAVGRQREDRFVSLEQEA